MDKKDRKKTSFRKYSTSSASTGNINKVKDLFHNKFAVVICVVVVLVVLVLVLNMCGSNSEEGETTDTMIVSGTEETVDPATYELRKDAVPELNELVNTYFEAMKNCDAQAYQNIVVGDEITEEKLQKKGEYVEDYRNISCYTKPGMTDGSYVAYVYYEIKFHNIDTLAPGLSLLYVDSNEDGSMYINAGSMDAELAGYINTVSAEDQVRQLIKDTDDSLTELRASDEKLDSFIKKLGDIEPEPETEAPETTEENIDEMTFEERNETVLTTTTVRYRSTPTTGTDENVLGSFEAGEELTRIGYNDKWSKIRLKNGDEVYVSSDYLITK